MNKIAIWGAASGLGAAMLDYFHEQDLAITAIVRNPDKNPRISELNIDYMVCDATNKEQIFTTVSKLPKGIITISTMGSFQAEVPVDYIGHRHLIDALEQFEHARFLFITSLGCGDSWRYLSERSRQGFGKAVREKSLAEAWLQSSQLDFTILRPGGLKNGDITNTGKLSQHQEVHGLITRSEVARLSLQLLKREDSIGQIYECVDPELTY